RHGTQLALLGLVAYGILGRPNARTWVLAILLLLAATVVITKPQATVQKAAALGTAVPNLMLGAVSQIAPSQETDGAPNADEAQKRLASRYWDSFVAHPLSRVQTGTAVLATADPARKPSVLQSLGKNVSGVHDWAIGRHGPERAFIATSAVGYVLPFAITLGVLAMVAACAQTLLFLLCLAALFVVPLAVQGPRRRGQVIRWWLLPLLATVVLLAFTSLLSLTVMRVANALHSSDEYIGVLLAGATWPIVALILIRWRLTRPHAAAPRRRGDTGTRLAATVMLLPLRLLRSRVGRRLIAVAALALVLTTVVGALYDHPDAPPRGRGKPPANRPSREVGRRPEDAAANWFARRHGVDRADVQALQQEQVGTNERRVLVMADAGDGRLPTGYVTVHRDGSGWAVG